MEDLRDLMAAGTRMRHALARNAGLSETEMVTLDHLVRGPVGPGELARRLEVSTAASTGIVDRLEGRGHVERRPHPEDRRRTEVHVTDSGRSEVLGHLMPMLDALRALDGEFDDAERAVVRRYLRGAAQAMGRASQPVDAPPEA